MSEVVWQDPPDINHGSGAYRNGPTPWQRRLAPLMEHPKRWAVVRTYDNPAIGSIRIPDQARADQGPRGHRPRGLGFHEPQERPRLFRLVRPLPRRAGMTSEAEPGSGVGASPGASTPTRIGGCELCPAADVPVVEANVRVGQLEDRLWLCPACDGDR